MRNVTFAQAIREAMCEEMRRDSDVFIMGEDIGVYGGCFGVTEGMLAEFGKERVIDTPITEQAYTGAGLGAALAGMRPVVELMFSDFATVCFDLVANETSKMRFMTAGKKSLPVTFRAPCGCGTGAASQHSQSLEALFAHMPGIRIIMPSTPNDAKGLLKAAIRCDDPVIFLEPKTLYKTEGLIPDKDYVLPIGKADIKKTGKDLTVITYGRTVDKAMTAANELIQYGLYVEVIDLRTIKPFDIETCAESAASTGRVLIAHEAGLYCGMGAEIASQLYERVFDKLKKPIKRLGAPDCPVPMSKPLEDHFCPQEKEIKKAMLGLMK